MARFGTLSLCLFLLGACDTTSRDDNLVLDGEGGDARPDGGDPSTPPVLNGLPKVGQRLSGGTVSGVRKSSWGSPGCYEVEVEFAPKWSCSEAQVDALRKDVPQASDLKSAYEKPEALRRVNSCTELADVRRHALKRSLRQTLEAQLGQMLGACSPTRLTYHYDKSGMPSSSCYPRVLDASVGYPQPTTPQPDDGADQYSTTNTQVDGVDEADFVKNDSGHVYVLSKAGLHVIDAWPAAETHQLAQVALPGAPTRLFLAGDKLVVYSRLGDSTGTPSQAAGCSYGFACRTQAEPGRTLVQVFDVRVPEAPVELTRYELSGGYVASRRVGSVVHTVVSDWGLGAPPSVDLTLGAPNVTELGIAYAAKVRNVDAAVDALDDAYFLPRLTMNGTTEVACASGLVAPVASGTSFTSLVSFDLNALGTPKRELIASNPGYVYASGQALYLASDGPDGADSYSYDVSRIHKFALDGAATRYVGTAQIPGGVLNQFSMDERDGVLRVATTTAWRSNQLLTLAEREGELRVIGQLNDLAPGETIRSVRFDGERGFVVTFRQVDPLFAIDLANAAQPRVLGELKIPGFSTYMHPLDADHLLTIGVDETGGIQLQIFDVSTLTAPQLQHKTVIPVGASEALTNHLAFTYFAPKNLLLLPISQCAGATFDFNGLLAYDVSLDQGIVEHGRMPFARIADGSCHSTWAFSRSTVKRSFVMDDFVIGISDTQYQVAGLAALGQTLKSLPLGL